MNMLKKRRLGFTLIEVLVATSIFAVVIVSIYSAFQTGITTYRKVDASFGAYQTARLVLARIESDLRSSSCYSDEDCRFQGAGDSLDFFSVLPAFDSSGKERVNICRVRYIMDGGSLKRASARGLDAIMKDPDFKPGELSSLVKNISFEYAFPKKEFGKTYEWKGSWPEKDDEAGKKMPPLAVKIELSVAAPAQKAKAKAKAKEEAVTFTKIVSLAPASFKNE